MTYKMSLRQKQLTTQKTRYSKALLKTEQGAHIYDRFLGAT